MCTLMEGGEWFTEARRLGPLARVNGQPDVRVMMMAFVQRRVAVVKRRDGSTL